MKIAIGSDHAGFRYKERLKVHLEGGGNEVADFGTDSDTPVEYPLFIRPVAEAVAAGRFARGIVLGGSGNGEAMVANRVRGVRCAVCWNVESARLARLHNDANILSLGERLIAADELLPIVDTWLATGFEGGRHVRRLELIDLPATTQATTVPEAALLRLDVYVNYRGTCEQAFRFYEQHLGGRITGMVRHAEQGDASLPDDWRNKILHARIEIGSTVLMGADIAHAEPMRSAYLTLSLDREGDAERAYALLADQGEVFMKMEKTPFANRFAMLRDRFGTSWMLLHQLPPGRAG